MKSKDYTNLRDKTIFDFCSDEAVLDDLLFTKDKKEYLESLKHNNGARWMGLLDFAEYSGNKELEKAVRDEFSEEISALFNE